MTLAERIPSMTDAELASLHVNALRLSAGDSSRNREASDLLPALEAEVSARKLRRAEATGSRAGTSRAGTSRAGTGGRKGRTAS
jgi:hypothetical protein